MAREKSLLRRETGDIGQIEPWNTFRDMERMMRNFFTSPFPVLRSPLLMRELETEFIPDVDLRETDKEFILSATIPGMSKDDIDINVTDDGITLTGERKTEEEKPGERYHLRQQSYGKFSVSYALPSDVKTDEVKATYRDGVLEVVLPKAEVKEAHKVNIQEKSE